MKKTAILLLLMVLVFFASSGLIQACELCDAMHKLGYSNNEIARIIRGAGNRAEAEARIKEMLRFKRPHPQQAHTKSDLQPPQPTQQTINPDPFNGKYQWNGKHED